MNSDLDLTPSLFHEPWWLSAATGGRYEEASVKEGGRLIGRFPFLIVRRGPFKILSMPAFTHLLGPSAHAGSGKPQTQLMKRLWITRTLVEQLPRVTSFKQLFDPTVAGGLAIADGLAFQNCGFRITPQYTFRFDCHRSPESIWDGMHFKVRQHIRRAQERYSVVEIDDPDRFAHVYTSNLKQNNKINKIDFGPFAKLFSECRTRDRGVLLAAVAADGSPAAMVYLVWGHGIMYYLLSTRDRRLGGSGSVSLLIWSAINRAHKLNMNLDLDGVSSDGTARFLKGFGGQITVRYVATRAHLLNRALQVFRTQFITGDKTENYV